MEASVTNEPEKQVPSPCDDYDDDYDDEYCDGADEPGTGEPDGEDLEYVAQQPPPPPPPGRKPAVKPPPTPCPDPVQHVINFYKKSAGAEERARIRKERSADLKDRAAKLEASSPETDTAQSKYERALAKQKENLKLLRETLLRIGTSLDCSIKDPKTRESLVKCFCTQIEGATQSSADPNPELSCSTAKTQDVEKLRVRESSLLDGIKWTEKRFDELVKLPDELESLVQDLMGRAKKLESDLCGPEGLDPLRGYVEWLELRHEAWMLRDKLKSGRDYGCLLRRWLVDLVERYSALVCISGWLKEKEREEELRKERLERARASLVDLVLQCAEPTAVGEQPETWADLNPCPAPCKPSLEPDGTPASSVAS